MLKIFKANSLLSILIIIFLFTLSGLYAKNEKSLTSIIQKFNKAGFSGEIQKANPDMLLHFSKLSKPGKAVDAIIFQNKKHPCLIIKFNSQKAAKNYLKHPFTKNEIKRKGKKSNVRYKTFILSFDRKKDISSKMIKLFKKR
jgi:hypothetical protein